MATGAVTNFYGNAEIQKKAIAIKGIEDALSLRNTILNKQTDFYHKIAANAARSGVCLDLYIVARQRYTDVASLKFLTLLTGGNLMLYERTDDASLPQDVFRQVKKPHVSE